MATRASVTEPARHGVGHAEAGPSAGDPGAGALLLLATATASAADLGWMLLIGEPIPPLVGFAVLAAAAVVGLRRRPRPRAVVLGGLALMALAMGGPFFVAEASHPQDPGGFGWAVLSGGGRLVALAGAVIALRAPRLARPVGRAAIASAAALLAVGAIASATVRSDAPVAGDVVVPARDTTFPERIEVPAGGALLVDNEDRWRHTFSVDETAIDVDLPPSAARRIPIELAPGEYRVLCLVHGHESMTSTLVVR